MCSNIFPTFESELELGWVASTGAGVTDVQVVGNPTTAEAPTGDG